MTLETQLQSPAAPVAQDAPGARAKRRPVSRAAFWTGWVLSVLPSALLLLSATMKFLLPPAAVEGFEQLGWSKDLALGLGIVEVAVVVIYLFPPTAVLGAILITGYLGGAIATHVRVGDVFIMPLLLGIVAWIGLYLREPRLRALAPWRR